MEKKKINSLLPESKQLVEGLEIHTDWLYNHEFGMHWNTFIIWIKQSVPWKYLAVLEGQGYTIRLLGMAKCYTDTHKIEICRHR